MVNDKVTNKIQSIERNTGESVSRKECSSSVTIIVFHMCLCLMRLVCTIKRYGRKRLRV